MTRPPLMFSEQLSLRGFFEPTCFQTANFDPALDAERLYKAMKGFGCNKNELIDVLGNRVSMERTKIAEVYENAYGKSLKATLKSETSGDLCHLLCLLVEPIAYVEAYGLYKAMEGFGTRERQINQILLQKSNTELTELEKEYRQVLADRKKPSTRNLVLDLYGETSSDYKLGLNCIMKKQRHELSQNEWRIAMEQGAEAVIDWKKAKEDAIDIYNATVGQEGADAAVIMEILLYSTQYHIQAIRDCFYEATGAELYDVLSAELGGDFRDLCLDAVEQATEQTQYYARLLRKTMAGLGTDDCNLQRLIVTRSEIDLGSIKQSYEELFGVPLKKDIIGDTSGDYEKLLLILIGEQKK